MPRAWLAWFDGENLRVASLRDEGEHLLGRTPGATVDLSDETKYERYRTVSRRHALVRNVRGGLLLEHLSQSNPTFVNGARIERPVPLRDGDILHLGDVQVEVHDLAAADRISGPICPHCGRENESNNHECWFCGTALVNQRSEMRRRIPVAFRVVSAEGKRVDAYLDDAVIIGPERVAVSTSSPPPPDAVVLTATNQGPTLQQPTVGTFVTVNGAPARDGQSLVTGDTLRIGDLQAMLLVD